tara:strand:+ start:609 stop:1805 length:1197 start_codon:yes stop_codon:yes gene_type:complete
VLPETNNETPVINDYVLNPHIKSVFLSHFRSYETLKLNCDAKFIVLNGENGAGKTNILEAISLFSPGRGIRNAKTELLQNAKSDKEPWSINLQIINNQLKSSLSAFSEIKTKSDNTLYTKKNFRLDNQHNISQTGLADYINMIWLTPQMERLFIDSSSERRRFFDRFVFTFDPAHAGRLIRFDNTLRERSKLLKQGIMDDSWLGALEQTLAETASAIMAARIDLCQKLNAVIARLENIRDYFPKATITLDSWLYQQLENNTALEIEDFYKETLKKNRTLDAQTGGTAQGPQKTDFEVFNLDKNMPSQACSTGEQKALLITLILAHSLLIQEEKGQAPILLLDDIVSHLDENRRENLFDYLKSFGSQCWLTGVERQNFNSLENQAQFFKLENSHIINNG